MMELERHVWSYGRHGTNDVLLKTFWSRLEANLVCFLYSPLKWTCEKDAVLPECET